MLASEIPIMRGVLRRAHEQWFLLGEALCVRSVTDFYVGVIASLF